MGRVSGVSRVSRVQSQQSQQSQQSDNVGRVAESGGVGGVRQTMASPENLGSLYFSAAAWALEMVGLEMMIGLALSEARLKRVSGKTCLGPCLL